MTRFLIKLRIDRLPHTLRLVSRSGYRRTSAFTVMPGGLLGRKCLICNGGIEEGGRFVLCPRCRNVYHLDCLMALDDAVCIYCGRPLNDVIKDARLIIDAGGRDRTR